MILETHTPIGARGWRLLRDAPGFSLLAASCMGSDVWWNCPVRVEATGYLRGVLGGLPELAMAMATERGLRPEVRNIRGRYRLKMDKLILGSDPFDTDESIARSATESLLEGLGAYFWKIVTRPTAEAMAESMAVVYGMLIAELLEMDVDWSRIRATPVASGFPRPAVASMWRERIVAGMEMIERACAAEIACADRPM